MLSEEAIRKLLALEAKAGPGPFTCEILDEGIILDSNQAVTVIAAINNKKTRENARFTLESMNAVKPLCLALLAALDVVEKANALCEGNPDVHPWFKQQYAELEKALAQITWTEPKETGR